MEGIRRLPRILFLAFALGAVAPALSVQSLHAQETRLPVARRVVECTVEAVVTCAEPIRAAPTPLVKVVIAILCTIEVVVCVVTG
ncbi:MAG TPA: hypothetical protein VNZ57_10780 [Longimicrobiales bacterium]|nr:hypothetical protein [Longimicrobiales bacterium]